jgi:hypothetical protein
VNVSSNIFPTPQKSEPFENTPICPPKYSIVRGPDDFLLVGILIFLLLRSPCKIAKPYDNPSWENYQ